MPRVDDPIRVKTREGSPLPTLFRWNGDTFDVHQILDVWRKETKWWRPEGPERRDYYRCVVKSGSAARGGHRVVEMYRRYRQEGADEDTESDAMEWILARQID
jgi:hypothetical protein